MRTEEAAGYMGCVFLIVLGLAFVGLVLVIAADVMEALS